MDAPTEHLLTGPDALACATTLLQRIRTAHPTAGLYEAADPQWWWSQRARPTDDVPQLCWLDHLGRPVAAVLVTAFGDRTQFDPIVLPGADPEWVGHVVERGLAHAGSLGIETLTLEVDPADQVLRDALVGHGFTHTEDGVVEAWLAATERPTISPLPSGYRLRDRLDALDRPHHMASAERNHPDPQERLRQTSLYRPDLDLVVLDDHDAVAAYGLFWYDPATRVGLVEPMRTEDAHQQRGLARHVLTAGLDLLAGAGAERIKICYEPDNPASSHLYLSVGFRPDRQTQMFARPG